jgi:type I restriction-modification system DNA methylase subunit
MRLPFQEIRNRAIQFAHDWRDAHSERAEAQTFWNEFFNVFGINRRSVASFEATVRNLGGSYDRIDVIWQGVLIGEHKSRGEDLSRAASQAFGYVQSLTTQGRDDEVPRYVIVSDFARMVLYDLEAADPTQQAVQFDVADLHQNIRRFDFLSGIQSRAADPEDPINIRAVEVLGQLHDVLERSGYTGHQLERFLVRILFCLFAEDTGIFEPDAFKLIVENSSSDGSDLGPMLERLFRVLDTADDSRQTGLPEALAAMPYVNGELFAERLDMAEFNADTRNALLAATRFQWSKISPAVFGSLFQSIMASEAGARRRRQIGAHYTSERDIMKLIRSLFLDDLRADFERAKARRSDLVRFHDRIANLKFLDPACGCGNFLVIAYRELRRLEIEVIAALHASARLLDSVDLELFTKIAVDQMHGIEIEEWPARIAEVAMWLIDHQMNLEASQLFGRPLIRLPLKKTAKIAHDNALRIDWNTVLHAAECSYVMGNPPFVGHHLQTAAQKDDQNRIWSGLSAAGVLDFVTCWYAVAADYIHQSSIRCAFVSTNSISQGEQPGIFWPRLLEKGIQIQFAHRTFKWESEARGRAHVHVVIIGFGLGDVQPRALWDYDNDDGNRGSVAQVSRLNPYLFDGPDSLLPNRSTPLCPVPGMKYGNKPTDGGHFLMTAEERDQLVRDEPGAAKWIRRYIGATEFLDGVLRYCLWLPDISPAELRSLPLVKRRVEQVKQFREASKAGTTREYAAYPTRFRQIAQTAGNYVLVPGHTSENRQYIPFAFFGPEVIASNACFFIPNATAFHFGVISSQMHMAWVKQFCGRIKSDYRYSKDIVYNNFPWPQEVDAAKKAAVEVAAQSVLDARAAFANQTLADLYDPLATPKQLRDAHTKLDRAVDKCYRSAAFTSDRQRVEFLFGLYERLCRPALPSALPSPTRRRSPRR